MVGYWHKGDAALVLDDLGPVANWMVLFSTAGETADPRMGHAFFKRRGAVGRSGEKGGKKRKEWEEERNDLHLVLGLLYGNSLI